MVKGKYISALDIGTSKVIALIGEVQEDNEIHIVGLGQAPPALPAIISAASIRKAW